MASTIIPLCSGNNSSVHAEKMENGACTLAPTLTVGMALVKLLNLLEAQFSHLLNGNSKVLDHGVVKFNMYKALKTLPFGKH